MIWKWKLSTLSKSMPAVINNDFNSEVLHLLDSAAIERSLKRMKPFELVQ